MQSISIQSAVSEEVLGGNLLYGVAGQSGDTLVPGQIVKADVVFSSEDTVNVKLTNGSIVRARLDNGVSLSQGDTVWFTVKENDGKSLVLQIMNRAETEGTAKMLTDMLVKAGLPNSRLNLKLAAVLVENELPVEPALIKQASDILENYPDVSIQAAVFAAANKLEDCGTYRPNHTCAEATMQISSIHTAAPEELLRGNLLNSIGSAADALSQGQVVEAEVLFVSEGMANVKLANGSIVRARLDNGVSLSQGDAVWLSVKENDGNSLVLQVLRPAESGSPANTLVELLAKAGVPSSRVNLELAAALTDSELPLEPAVIKQAGNILEMFPEASMKAAVFAAANKLEISAQTLRVLDSLLQSDFKASDLITRIFKLLTAPVSSKPPAPVPDTPTPIIIKGQASRPAENGLPAAATQPGATDAGEKAAPAQNVLETGLAQGFPAGEETQAARVSAGLIHRNGTGGQSPQPSPESIAAENAVRPDSGEDDGWQQLLKAGTDRTGNAKHEDWLKAAEKSFYAEIEKPEDAAALKKAAEGLIGRLELLKAFTDGAESAGHAALETNKLLGGLRLLDCIDRYTCMQIPIMTGGRPSTLELYVFNKKKKARKAGPDSTTVLLALDTEHLGRVEALVSIRKNSFAIRFNLENDAVSNYLRERTVALYNMVSARERHLSGVQFQTGGESVTPMTAPKIAEQYDSGVNRTFSVCI